MAILWLPDAVGTVASILLAIPAWRASQLLKVIFTLGNDASPSNPGSRRHMSDEQVREAVKNSIRNLASTWNRADDLMLKIGVVLLILSFIIRIVV